MMKKYKLIIGLLLTALALFFAFPRENSLDGIPAGVFGDTGADNIGGLVERLL